MNLVSTRYRYKSQFAKKLERLRGICIENPKSPFKVGDADNSGPFPFFTSGGETLRHSKHLVYGENIFLSTGGYAHVKYYKGRASYSADTWCLSTKKGVSTKYVYYQILAKMKFIDEVLFRGTGLRHLQKNEFLNLQIPLLPLPIQQKIVSILDTIQSAIEIQEKIIEKTKELKKSMMAELFKYGGPSFRKNRKLKKTEIGEIPEDWEVVRLGEVAEVTSSKRIFQSEYVPTGIPFYRSKEITELANNTFRTSEFFISQERFDEISVKYGVPKQGDILMTAIGTIGVSWVVPDGRKFYFKDGNILWIKNFKEIVSYYLKYFFDSFFKVISVLPTGATYKALTIDQLKNLKFSLPPLPEQREIAEILQTIDQKIEIEQKKKALYEELFRTMLNKIMTQEIDVEKINL